MKGIDLNCDMGELSGNDVSLIRYVSSCSIACGGHIGNKKSILKSLRLAQQHKKKIGAHPSYPDRVNFGRKSITISAKAFQESIYSQLELFFSIAAKQKVLVYHIKPHGALYHDLFADKILADLFIEIVKNFSQKIIIFCEPKSQLSLVALKKGLTIKYEGFVDRRYNDNGRLVSRTHPDALIEKEKEVVQQVLKMIRYQKVTTISGKEIPIGVQTICLHSDTPNSIKIAKELDAVLRENKIIVA